MFPRIAIKTRNRTVSQNVGGLREIAPIVSHILVGHTRTTFRWNFPTQDHFCHFEFALHFISFCSFPVSLDNNMPPKAKTVPPLLLLCAQYIADHVRLFPTQGVDYITDDLKVTNCRLFLKLIEVGGHLEPLFANGDVGFEKLPLLLACIGYRVGSP